MSVTSLASAARPEPLFKTHLAQTDEDRRAVQRLRYEVFVAEMGATGDGVNHDKRLEADRFDPVSEHLVLRDLARAEDDQVVGSYRLLSQDHAREVGGFYSQSEFDLDALLNSGRSVLELGRSCLHADYRGGVALAQLWAALANHVTRHNIDVLFGVASFPGTAFAPLAESVSHLHHAYLAPEHLRVTSRTPLPGPLIEEHKINRLAAMRATPSLIKGYLRLGGKIGEGVFVDHDFNTTDVCLILDTSDLRDGAARLYQGTAQ